MKKQVLLIMGGIFISLLLVIDISIRLDDSKEIILKEDTPINKVDNMISMMYETSSGSGEYQESGDNAWPQSGYIFNSTLSKCENGSTLSWDESTKKVQMMGNVSDKCYVYFDKEIAPLFSDYIKKTVYTGVQGENNIYYHKNLDNSAEDGSYRYAGSYEAVNNYVCMGDDVDGSCPGDKLYRVIGVFNNNVKLIKADCLNDTEIGNMLNLGISVDTKKAQYTTGTVAGIFFGNGNNWANEDLNKTVLNGSYLNVLGDSWNSKIATTTWQVGGNTWEKIGNQNAATAYQNEIVNPLSDRPELENKIGLMYVSDYGFAASPSAWTTILSNYNNSDIINSNWIFNGIEEWTITRRYYSDTDKYKDLYVNKVNRNGNIYHERSDSTVASLRPVFYLKANVTKLSGDGSANSPYRIGTRENTITFKINDEEYVAGVNMTWKDWFASEYYDAETGPSSISIIRYPVEQCSSLEDIIDAEIEYQDCEKFGFCCIC